MTINQIYYITNNADIYKCECKSLVSKAETKTINHIGNIDFLRLVLLVCGTREKKSNIKLERPTFKYITRLQKLIFIAQNEFDEYQQLIHDQIVSDEPFVYRPDNYGPFSKDLTIVIKKLIQNEEIEEESSDYGKNYAITRSLKDKISQIDRSVLDNSTLLKILSQVAYFYSLPLKTLLAHVYQNPKYDALLTQSLILKQYRAE